MNYKLDEKSVIREIDIEDINKASYKDIVDTIFKEERIAGFKPDNICTVDPRNNDRIIYSKGRARRPHDNVPGEIKTNNKRDCVVCNGETTRIIDKTPLSEGFTFINKNLFPIFYPEGYYEGIEYGEPGKNEFTTEGEFAPGLHLLQWSSNYHDKDISNMPLEDVKTVLKRLSILEEKLLHSKESGMPSTKDYEKEEHFGYAGIIKNYGRLVGGSLVHGHQQIVHTGIMPGKIKNDRNFRKKNGITFSNFMLNNNPPGMTLKDLKTLKIIVPYFMKRSLDTMIILKNTDKNYLHDFNEEELEDMSKALRIILGAVPEIMNKIGREPAYNVIFHNGPSVGFYIEILPYTQETGGYEHLGIYICQGSPEITMEMYKNYMEE